MNLFELAGKKTLFFDGAMGSQLFEKGMETGGIPELYNIDYPDIVRKIHGEFIDAGCDIVTTNTFGANKIKLNDSSYSVIDIVIAAVENAQAAIITSGKDALVAFDMGPTGKLLSPLGDLHFDEAYEAFAEVAIAAEKAGANLAIIETMTDTYEMKAAVLAVKENTSLPIIATFSFDKNGRLLTGGDIATAVTLLEALSVDALGLNCGFGPDVAKNLLPDFIVHSSIPLIIQPNAGMPKTLNGKTIYDISPQVFAEYQADFYKQGVAIIGGCCGTTPEHIRLTVKACEKLECPTISNKNKTVVSSFAKTQTIGDTPVIIGERINPTGKKAFKQALKEKNLDYILNEGLQQQEKGAHILDVNVGLPEINEVEMMLMALETLQPFVYLPLQIDTADPIVLEHALRYYNGKALVNSVNGSESSMHSVFPIVKKYGGVVVALTLDDDGIPETAQGRFEIAKKILKTANEYGIDKKDIIFDSLTMTVSSNPKAANIALDALKLIKNSLCVKTILGVSNVSFGLPKRDKLNSVFFAEALRFGLDAAIINPVSDVMMDIYFAHLALSGNDMQCAQYINRFSDSELILESQAKTDLFKAIVSGAVDYSFTLAQEQLKKDTAENIIENILIKALDEVGKGFDSKRLFLPQLIKSAEAAKSAFEAIKEGFEKSNSNVKKKNKVLLATVKGDIHDIGKNICKIMLENYGFEVVDLGKDVSCEQILSIIKKEDIKLVGLSALMTTTVANMESIIKEIKINVENCKVMVGGAVLTAEYAQLIGADFYANDAMAGVGFAQRVFAK